jgi:glycosyltransferase involved in cell wall biosynthesis
MGDRTASRALFYFCNVGWFFLSHRLPLAAAAKLRGYDVHVVCDIESDAEAEALTRAGLTFHRIRLSRGGLNPFRELGSFFSILILLLRYRPVTVHNISIKPVLYASIAARITGIQRTVNAISGLGYLFIDAQRTRRLLRVVRATYRIALSSPSTRVIFQNEDDMRDFVRTELVRPEQAVLIEGSGVDLSQFSVSPEPAGQTIRIVLPARMLADKGVVEFAGAALELKKAGLPVECLLAGGVDRANPAALTEADMLALEAQYGVRWLGHVVDMAKLLADCHIVCLPSYREGLPKALIEACAVGRPIVTTDVPGCRAVVRNGINGILVPARQTQPLFQALSTLVLDRSLRLSMGARAREIAEREFGIESVVARTLNLYRQLPQSS